MNWSFNTIAFEIFQAKPETNVATAEENSTLQIEGINYVLPSELQGDISDYTVVVLPEGTTVSSEKLEIALSGHVDEQKLVLQQETVQAMLGMAGTTNDNPRKEDLDKKKSTWTGLGIIFTLLNFVKSIFEEDSQMCFIK